MLNSNSNLTRLFLALPLVSALIQLNGCATIFTGTTDTLKFDANVPGVRLTIDAGQPSEPARLPDVTLDLGRLGVIGCRSPFTRSGTGNRRIDLPITSWLSRLTS